MDSLKNIDIAKYIDHALLDPSATPEQVATCCAQAEKYKFAAVCLYPSAVRQARELLTSKKVKLCTVIGFPTGATTSNVKLYEAQEAVENGAEELDVMINLGYLKAGNSEQLYREIAQICSETGKVVKAILETNLLTNTEKRLAAEICLDAGVAYLKTCTGWFGGANVEDVRFLHKITQGKIGIKASGGIRNLATARELIKAGATRLGTSRGVELVTAQEQDESEL